jgi:hypothetical protein
MAFLGCSRGHRIEAEAECPTHTAPNNSLDTHSRTRALPETRLMDASKGPGEEGSRETLKLLAVSSVLGRNLLLSSKASK